MKTGVSVVFSLPRTYPTVRLKALYYARNQRKRINRNLIERTVHASCNSMKIQLKYVSNIDDIAILHSISK